MVYSIAEHNRRLSNKLKIGKWQILFKHWKDNCFDIPEYQFIIGIVKYHSIPSEGEMMYLNKQLYK